VVVWEGVLGGEGAGGGYVSRVRACGSNNIDDVLWF